jgi:hypothetical protein
VFDARGSMGLDDEDVVSRCHVCENPSGRLDKCHSDGCYLVLVVCEDCSETKVATCCQDCRDMDIGVSDLNTEKKIPRRMCACEKERETQLWAGARAKKPTSQGRRKQKRKDIDIQVHIVEDVKS